MTVFTYPETAHVRRHGPLDSRDALALLWPVARALQAIHGRGVLHRCLTPWSILIRKDDPPLDTDEEDVRDDETPDDTFEEGDED